MTDKKIEIYAILLAGGTGTRLWPVSRELYPKQLVNFIGRDSLVQSTVKRLSPVLNTEKIRIVCGKEHFHEISRHIKETGINPQGKVIAEPCGRNTAPAILLGVLNILKNESDAILCVFPADHVIRDVGDFQNRLKSAIHLADEGHIVTFGIRPDYPETGYGYIEGGKEISAQALRIKRFVEKPDMKTAETYLKAGNFFWNSGMFVFKASVISEAFGRFHPEMLRKMQAMMSDDSVTKEAYQQLEDISIDYAVMEKTDRGVMLPSDFGWSDIGSWKSLYDFLPKDGNRNVIDGDVIAKDTENCFIMGRQRLIAVNRLNNMVVVETPDSVFVSDMENSRDVKSIVADLKKRGRKEYHKHKTVHHPWGTFTLLEQKENLEVAEIAVDPGSAFVTEPDGRTLTFTVIVSGTATTDRQHRMAKGESKRFSENETVHLENSENEMLHIIQTRVGQQ
jgi:mannose-1-phosphate guanylyltransferase/mannose-6-phosphate isomerase